MPGTPFALRWSSQIGIGTLFALELWRKSLWHKGLGRFRAGPE